MLFALIALFATGYTAIAFEHKIKINKAAVALVTGALSWAMVLLGADQISSNQPADDIFVSALLANHPEGPVGFFVEELSHHLGAISEILFFLLGAMTIVELVDAHDGFRIITDRIRTTKKTKLLWLIGLLTFFLSAILDNLTTAIVMVSMLRKLIDKKEDRWLFTGVVIIAANAGGAWSPIGDVTTTMLWISGRISSVGIIGNIFWESLVCLLVPLILLSFTIKGQVEKPREYIKEKVERTSAFERNLVFYAAIAGILMVPLIKRTLHIPAYMGMLLILGCVWVLTEIIHRRKNEEDRSTLSVVGVIRKIDTPSVMFFLGILLTISALESIGALSLMAQSLQNSLQDTRLIAVAIGLISAIVDNVPLVAASIGMYKVELSESLNQAFVKDGQFWTLLAYCSGTGGSVLIIGSAAGVAAMGIEEISFVWYLKRISWLALSGYLAGVLVFMLRS